MPGSTGEASAAEFDSIEKHVPAEPVSGCATATENGASRSSRTSIQSVKTCSTCGSMPSVNFFTLTQPGVTVGAAGSRGLAAAEGPSAHWYSPADERNTA